MLSALTTNNHQIPLAPTLPVLDAVSSLLTFASNKSILDDERAYHVASGSAAIYFALKAHQVQAGDHVLVPAYHCPAMVEPVLRLGATPVFYSITEDIAIDVDSISALLNAQTKAILVPHFFAVKQDIAGLKQRCQLPASVCIIEDYAHAFFGLRDIEHVAGDYLIGSLTKFFPVYDGGLLVARQGAVEGIKALSFKQELKAIYNVFHDAIRYGRMRHVAWLFNIVLYARQLLSTRQDEVDNNADDSEELDAYTKPLVGEEMLYGASKISSYIAAHCDADAMIQQRQVNYRRIISALEGVSNIDLSLNCMDESFIPYMVIGRLRKPELHHAKLIANGLPIWRWENIYASNCEISARYAQSIIQIPCHQELSEDEITALIDGITKSLASD